MLAWGKGLAGTLAAISGTEGFYSRGAPGRTIRSDDLT